jgi:hypothetical protein
MPQVEVRLTFATLEEFQEYAAKMAREDREDYARNDTFPYPYSDKNGAWWTWDDKKGWYTTPPPGSIPPCVGGAAKR